MSNMDDMNQFQRELSEHRVTPPSAAWGRIENKMSARSHKMKLRRRQFKNMILGIAACAVVLLVVKVNDMNNQHLFSRGQVASWEELEFSASDATSTNDIKKLNAAYAAYLNGLRGNHSSSGTKVFMTQGTN